MKWLFQKSTLIFTTYIGYFAFDTRQGYLLLLEQLTEAAAYLQPRLSRCRDRFANSE